MTRGKLAEHKRYQFIYCNLLTVRNVKVYVALLFPKLFQEGRYMSSGPLSQCHSIRTNYFVVDISSANFYYH